MVIYDIREGIVDKEMAPAERPMTDKTSIGGGKRKDCDVWDTRTTPVFAWGDPFPRQSDMALI